MNSNSQLLLALAFVVAFALAGINNSIGYFLVGFLLACGAYAAMYMLGRNGAVVLGGADPKKKW